MFLKNVDKRFHDLFMTEFSFLPIGKIAGKTKQVRK